MPIDVPLLAGVLAVVVLIGLAIAVDGGRRGASFPFITWIVAALGTAIVGLIAAFVIGVVLGLVVGTSNGGIVGLAIAAITVFGGPIIWAIVFRRRAHATPRR